MSIFDYLQEKGTGRRAMNSMVPFEVDVTLAATGAQRIYTPDMNEEYVLSLQICQRFWANKVQLSHARQAAMHAIASHLYRNIHHELHMLDLAIASGMADEAGAAIARIRKEMTP